MSLTTDTPVKLRPDTRGWLAIAFVAILVLVLVITAFNRFPEGNKDLFVFMAGQVVGAAMLAIVNFYFGSSKGAADANARADKAMAALQAPDAGDGK